MTLDLTDEETAALELLLSETINADRYPLSPRILTFEGDPRQDPAGAGAQAPAAAAALRAAVEREIPATRLSEVPTCYHFGGCFRGVG
jgi:hypothetical protein